MRALFAKGGLLDPDDPFTPLAWFTIVLILIVITPFVLLILGTLYDVVLGLFGQPPVFWADPQ